MILRGARAGGCAAVLFVGIQVAGCGGSETLTRDSSASNVPDVGHACVPGDEEAPNFAGFSAVDVTVDEGAGCSEACLVDHFRGRVSCPYGQPGDPSAPANERCYLPQEPATAVDVPVMPQLPTRPAAQAVYCSCNCGGPHPCACPGGFTCTSLADGLAGSYCVKDGTALSDEAVFTLSRGAPCDATAQTCGPPRPTFSLPSPLLPGHATTTLVDTLNVSPGRCLPIRLPVSGGRADCHVVEAMADSNLSNCSARPGRAPVSAFFSNALRAYLKADGLCDGTQGPTPSCDALALCEIEPADASCLLQTPSAGTVGWCYVSPSEGLGDPSLVAACPPTELQTLRFVDSANQTPAPGAITLLACGVTAT